MLYNMGDLVKVIKVGEPEFSYLLYRIGKIVEIGTVGYHIRFDNDSFWGKYTWYLDFDMVELAYKEEEK